MVRWKERALAAAVIAAASGYPWAQHPGAGWERDDAGFYVQNRTNAPMAERYTFIDGVHTCQVYRGEERVEMRWDTWQDQGMEHLWQSEVMFEAGTQQTCIMQVKSNTNGEAVYMQVFDGNLHHGAKGTAPVLRDHYGKWFHMRVTYDPKTRLGKVWINDALVVNRTHANASADWYFKNGTYGTLGHSKSHYRNLTLWKKTGAATSLSGSGRRISPWIASRPAAKLAGLYDLSGRVAGRSRPGLAVIPSGNRP